MWWCVCAVRACICIPIPPSVHFPCTPMSLPAVRCPFHLHACTHARAPAALRRPPPAACRPRSAPAAAAALAAAAAAVFLGSGGSGNACRAGVVGVGYRRGRPSSHLRGRRRRLRRRRRRRRRRGCRGSGRLPHGAVRLPGRGLRSSLHQEAKENSINTFNLQYQNDCILGLFLI